MDRDQFMVEVLKYDKVLQKVASKFTRHDPHYSADAIQSTYMKALLNYEKFTPGSNLKAWLVRILFNNVQDQGRRLHHQVSLDEYIKSRRGQGDLDGPTSLHYDQDFEIDNEGLDHEINQAINSIPKDYALPLIKSVLEDKSYKQISTELNVPVGTIMSRTWRGRQLLQEKLKDVQN